MKNIEIDFEKTALYMANLDNEKSISCNKNMLILFNCSKTLKKNSNSTIKIVSPRKEKNIGFIKNTLMYFGVPDNNIFIEAYTPLNNGPRGIWVMVS